MDARAGVGGGGGLVTAGLIDAHTHPVYAGDRMAEVAMRSAGATYEEVGKAGGGIRATVTATRGEPISALEVSTARRLRSWLEGGTTTVEAKTGYHLRREGELEATRLVLRLGGRKNLARIEATFLAHAGVAATLAPGTALSIGRLPPVQDLVEAGAVIALGTDHNPGTSGLTSMSLVIALAVAVFKLSVERALLAATVGGATSLLRSDRGLVAPRKLADLVLWEAEHEGAFAWAYGLKPRVVWLRGAQVFAR